MSPSHFWLRLSCCAGRTHSDQKRGNSDDSDVVPSQWKHHASGSHIVNPSMTEHRRIHNVRAWPESLRRKVSPRVDKKLSGRQRPHIAERPFLLTGVVVATIGVATISAGLLVVVLGLSEDLVELAAELFLAFLTVAIVTRMRLWRAIGLQTLRALSDLRFFWVLLFPVLIALPAVVARLGGVEPARALERLAFWVVLAVLIGFVEEVCFRGLILRALAPRGIWLAAVVSSLLFGLMHVLNLLSGADLGGTLLQVGYATTMGFAFAAAALRTAERMSLTN